MPLLARSRSEEHTSELQSQFQLVCRLLLEKKKRRFAVQHCFDALWQATPQRRGHIGGARRADHDCWRAWLYGCRLATRGAAAAVARFCLADRIGGDGAAVELDCPLRRAARAPAVTPGARNRLRDFSLACVAALRRQPVLNRSRWRRGHRIEPVFCCRHESAFGTKRTFLTTFRPQILTWIKVRVVAHELSSITVAYTSTGGSHGPATESYSLASPFLFLLHDRRGFCDHRWLAHASPGFCGGARDRNPYQGQCGVLASDGV